MHHHSKNEFSLFSCLVVSSFVFSSLVFSLLFRLLSSPGPCLLSLSLSVSVSFSVWCCVCDVLCFVVFCCVVCVCVLCVLMCVCVLVCDTLRNSVCPLNTSPCVRSKRHRVYRHHAHMLKHMCSWCPNTRGRFERTHGDVFSSVKQVIFDIS